MQQNYFTLTLIDISAPTKAIKCRNNTHIISLFPKKSFGKHFCQARRDVWVGWVTPLFMLQPAKLQVRSACLFVAQKKQTNRKQFSSSASANDHTCVHALLMCILSTSRREQLRPHKGCAMAADGGEVQSLYRSKTY